MRSEVYGVRINKSPARRGRAQGKAMLRSKSLLAYDSKLTKNLARLRSEIADIKRRMDRYGSPVSEDNFI